MLLSPGYIAASCSEKVWQRLLAVVPPIAIEHVCLSSDNAITDLPHILPPLLHSCTFGTGGRLGCNSAGPRGAGAVTKTFPAFSQSLTERSSLSSRRSITVSVPALGV